MENLLKKFIVDSHTPLLELISEESVDLKENVESVTFDEAVTLLKFISLLMKNVYRRTSLPTLGCVSILLAHEDCRIVYQAIDVLNSLTRTVSAFGRKVRILSKKIQLHQRIEELSRPLGSSNSEHTDGAERLTLQEILHCEKLPSSFHSLELTFKDDSGEKTAISVQDVRTLGSGVKQVFERLRDEYKVPSSEQFRLLTRIRRALISERLDTREQELSIRLVALTVAVVLRKEDKSMAKVLIEESECTTDLFDLVQSSITWPGELRLEGIVLIV